MKRFSLRTIYSWWLSIVALTLFAFGCGNGSSDVPHDAAGPDASPTHEISAFGFTSAKNPGLPADVSATISGDAISAPVLFGTSITSLVASFTTDGVSVTVGGVEQTSGVTANDFTNPVTYTVTAADGTTRDYVVTITVASSTAKDLTGFSFLVANNPSMSADATALISGTSITVTVPYGSNVAALKATFTSTGASVKVAGVTQVSGTTANDFTTALIYRVTAADSSTKDYTVTVTLGLNTAKDITGFSFLMANNASMSSDAIGNISSLTIMVTVPFGTNVTGLKATFTAPGATVTVGATPQVSGTTANNFTNPVTYRVTAADGSFQDYTVSVQVAANTAKDINTFSFLKANNSGLAVDVTGVVGTNTITATVPFGTNVTALKASFTTTGMTVTVGGLTQTSGSTANNFSSSVTYRVTAADASFKDYTVTVTIAAASTARDILTFSFLMSDNPGLTQDVTGVVGTTTVAATVPFGTNVTALKAAFTLSQFATVTVGGNAQTSGSTANNFTSAVTYHVIAQDGTSTKDYTVTVTIAPNTARDITAFSFQTANNPGLTSNVTGVIDQGLHTIAATVPFGTTVTALKATFTLSQNATVTVGGTPQVSGTTANNFTNPVTYHVIAQDGTSTQDYSVTVTIAPSPFADLTAFSFDAVNNSPGLTADAVGTIVGSAVSVALPEGTAVTGLKASFTVSAGASVTIVPGNFPQTSGSTANNFTNPVTYRVTAADGTTTKDYVVTITYTGQVSFGSFTAFTGCTNPAEVALADLNGDGKLDAAVACLSANTVEVYLGTTSPGATTPTMATKAAFAVGTTPTDLVIGDINNDGKPDLAVADSASAAISVLLNTMATGASTPTFATTVDFTTGASPFGVAAADFNGDGKLDLASASFGTGVTSVLLNTTSPGASTPTFATKVDFTTGTAPVSVTAADFNLDGLQDLAVANSQGDSVSVFLNTTTPGATTPTFATKVDFAAGDGPTDVTTGDFNGDGYPDISTANNNTGDVSVLLDTTASGASTPTFATKVDLVSGTNTAETTVGDVNGDGIVDLVAGTGDGNVAAFRNTTPRGGTTATFGARVIFNQFTASGKPQTVALGDINGDGKPDLVTANSISNTLNISLNTSIWQRSLTFAAKSDTTAGTTPQGVAMGDLNLDGKPDVVAVNSGGANVSVLLNATTLGGTTASLSAATNVTTGTTPYQASIVDVNGDGKPDIVVANSGSATISVLLNTTSPGGATASFATKVDFTTGTTPQSLAVGDFNHDGKPDAAVANAGSNTVSVLLNTTATGSTTITFAAKTDFATGTLPDAIASADFNGDGNLDLVACNQTSNTISVFFNTTAAGAATAAFATKVDFATGTQPRAVAVGDLNGDGKLDIAVANASTNNASIFLNTTSPGAATPTMTAKTDFAIGGSPFGIAMGDLNGDGKLDVAASTTTNAGVIANTTAPGAGTPVFATVSSFTTGTTPHAIAIGQVNADGKPDLVIANNGANSVSILLGK